MENAGANQPQIRGCLAAARSEGAPENGSLGLDAGKGRRGSGRYVRGHR
jgi:hypothetical protein